MGDFRYSSDDVCFSFRVMMAMLTPARLNGLAGDTVVQDGPLVRLHVALRH